jgi:hypothetical protein
VEGPVSVHIGFRGFRFLSIAFRAGCCLILSSIVLVDCSLAAEPVGGLVLNALDSRGKPRNLPARFALVIGIDSYDSADVVDISDLTAAKNDADAVGKVIQEAGFSTLPNLPGGVLTNESIQRKVTRNDIFSYVSQLADKAKRSKDATGRDPIVLVYFAGHGLSDDNDDYLLPANFNPYFAEDVSEMGVSIKQILQRLEVAHPALRIIITDSCRSQKPVSLKSMAGVSKTFSPGVNPAASHQDVTVAPNGTKIVFSTLRNSTSDGDGENGRFTGVFVKQIESVYKDINWTSEDPKDRPDGILLGNIISHVESALANQPIPAIQIPEDAGSADDFNLFPTKSAFKYESAIWDYYTADQPGMSANDVNIFHYCGYDSVLSNTSALSFFGDEAQSSRNDLYPLLVHQLGGAPDCQKWRDTLKVARAATDGEIVKTDAGTWSRAPNAAPPAPASATVVANRPMSSPPVSLAPVRAPHSPPAPMVPMSGDSAVVVVPIPSAEPAAPQGNGGSQTATGSGRDHEAVVASAAPATPIEAPNTNPQSEPLPTLVSDVLQSKDLSPEARDEVAKFDPSTQIRRLAVTVGRANVTASALSNSNVKTTVDAQKLVQVLDVSGEYVKIRTDSGVEGYVSGKLLDSIKIAATFNIEFARGSNEQISFDQLKAVALEQSKAILPHVILIDAAVRYPTHEKAVGFARAKAVADLVSEYRLPNTAAGAFIPRLDSDDSVEGGTVRLTITAYGLDKEAREIPTAISVSGKSMSVATATQAAAAVQEESPDLPACRTPPTGLESPDRGKIPAFIQYDGSDQQGALSARILEALKVVGFNKAKPDKVPLSNLPRTLGEVRRCPQFPASLTAIAVNALRACGMGEYRAVALPASACQKSATPNIEVWLARPASN